MNITIKIVQVTARGCIYFAILASQVFTAQAQLILEEILVTAEKNVTSSQDTPVAMTVLTGYDVFSQGIIDATHLSDLVPNLQIGNRGESVEISIRGIGSTNNVESGDPSVAFHLDGVYFGRPVSAGANFYDLERVEVLRGPQGTLYGRNATAGSINVITNSPAADFSALLGFEMGNYSMVKTEGMLNIPVGKAVMVRGAFLSYKHDGYLNTVNPSRGVTKDSSDADDISYRLQGLFIPLDSLSIRFIYDGFERKGVGEGNVFVPLNNDPRTVPLDTQGKRNIDEKGLSMTVNWEPREDVTLQYIAAHREMENRSSIDLDNIVTAPGDEQEGIVDISVKQTSHELQLSSVAFNSSLEWIAGLYYFEEPSEVYFEITNLDPVNLPSVNLAFDQTEVNAKSKAIFGQSTFAFSEQFSFTAGLRVTEDKKSREGNTLFVFPASGSRFVILPNIADDEWRSSDWKLNARWFTEDDAMFYATISTGYKAGGYFDGVPPGNSYDQEELLSYELGGKARFFDNRIQINSSLFFYEYTDFQVTQVELLPGGQGLGSVTRNAGEAHLLGAEVESNFIIGENGRFDLALSLLSTEFDEFRVADPADPLDHTKDRDFSGNELNKAPGWTLTLVYQHQWSLKQGGNVVGRLSTHWEGEQFLHYNNEAVTRQDKFHRSNLSLSYSARSDKWFIQAFVDNIEDDNVMTTISIDSFSTAALAAPRTSGIRFNINFE